MTSKVTIWLTDEQSERLTEKAERMDLTPWGLITLTTCAMLGEEIPKKKRGRVRWVAEQEIKTRQEYELTGSSTKRRLRELLQAANEPMSSTELRKGLGWKRTGSMLEILEEMDGVTQVSAPGSYERSRGRQPKFWTWTGPDSPR